MGNRILDIKIGVFLSISILMTIAVLVNVVKYSYDIETTFVMLLPGLLFIFFFLYLIPLLGFIVIKYVSKYIKNEKLIFLKDVVTEIYTFVISCYDTALWFLWTLGNSRS